MANSGRAPKVTITIPPDLFAWEERERAREGITRSAFIASLLRERREMLATEERAARYAAAYAAQPLTEEESAWIDAGGEVLAQLDQSTGADR